MIVTAKRCGLYYPYNDIERLARAHLELLGKLNQDYIGWARWRRRGDNQQAYLSICDSDAEGAFKIYRHPQTDELRAQKAALESGSEVWWDQNSVLCQCCSVEIVARGGDFNSNGMPPSNVGLSYEEGEEESICGFCAGDELHRLTDQRDALESQLAEARKDTVRLDYVQSKNYVGAIIWKGQADLGWLVTDQTTPHATLREAIDAAGALRAKPEDKP